jgi:hypothetical protein
MKKQFLISLTATLFSVSALAGEVTAPAPLNNSELGVLSRAQTTTPYDFHAALSIYGLSIYAYEQQLEELAFQRLSQNVQALLQQQECERNQRFAILFEQQLVAQAEPTRSAIY